MVETALVIITLIGMLVFIMNMGRIFLVQQFLTERARATVSNAVVNNWDATATKDYFAYNSIEAPEGGGSGFGAATLPGILPDVGAGVHLHPVHLGPLHACFGDGDLAGPRIGRNRGPGIPGYLLTVIFQESYRNENAAASRLAAFFQLNEFGLIRSSVSHPRVAPTPQPPPRSRPTG